MYMSLFACRYTKHDLWVAGGSIRRSPDLYMGPWPSLKPPMILPILPESISTFGSRGSLLLLGKRESTQIHGPTTKHLAWEKYPTFTMTHEDTFSRRWWHGPPTIGRSVDLLRWLNQFNFGASPLCMSPCIFLDLDYWSKVGLIQRLGEVTWVADVALPLTLAINILLDFTLIHDTLK
jgi:hypothetical protein